LGGNPRQLTFLNEQAGSPRWSPDGRKIVFDARIEGNPDIYLISAEGGTIKRLTQHVGLEEVPRWSRDGQWIYFHSYRSGESQIWKIPASGGELQQVTQTSGLTGCESSDGKRFFFNKEIVGAIWEIPAAGGEEKLLLDRQVPYWSWLVLDESLYFLTGEWVGRTYHWKIEKLDLPTGSISVFRQGYSDGTAMGEISASAGGEWFLLHESPPAEADLMLVEDFR
jgi:Tol biopolymer transport system component